MTFYIKNETNIASIREDDLNKISLVRLLIDEIDYDNNILGYVDYGAVSEGDDNLNIVLLYSGKDLEFFAGTVEKIRKDLDNELREEIGKVNVECHADLMGDTVILDEDWMRFR